MKTYKLMSLIVLTSAAFFVNTLSAINWKEGDICRMGNEAAIIDHIFYKNEELTSYLKNNSNKFHVREFCLNLGFIDSWGQVYIVEKPTDIIKFLSEKNKPVCKIKLIGSKRYKLCCADSLSEDRTSLRDYCKIL